VFEPGWMVWPNYGQLRNYEFWRRLNISVGLVRFIVG
jgi:hypothetical protein